MTGIRSLFVKSSEELDLDDVETSFVVAATQSDSAANVAETWTPVDAAESGTLADAAEAGTLVDSSVARVGLTVGAVETVASVDLFT